jgi:hypothetical protein
VTKPDQLSTSRLPQTNPSSQAPGALSADLDATAARKTFQITLCAARGTDDVAAIRALRAILKLAWRRFGLRAVDVREIPDRSDDPAKKGLSVSDGKGSAREPP